MQNKNKEIIAKNFGRYCENYNAYADIQKETSEKLCNLLPKKTKPKILEIGCGTGFLTKNILKKYPDGEFHITDLSPEMVQFCQSKYKADNVQFFVMDGENPNCDNEYDLIVSSMSVQWFEKPLESLKILAAKGDVYYSTLGSENFKEWKNVLFNNKLNDGGLPSNTWPNLIKEEFVHKDYQGGIDFLRMLKKIGAASSPDSYKKTNPTLLKRALSAFDGKITWHIVYGAQPRNNTIIGTR